MSQYMLSYHLEMALSITVVDPSGAPLACAPPPPHGPIFLKNSCSFLGKSGKFVCWHPLREGWRQLLRGILDPPLYYYRSSGRSRIFLGVGAPTPKVGVLTYIFAAFC